MRVFLDFEASSLAKASYPIEIAWVFEAGQSETHLIAPVPAWTDWDEGAAKIHGIARGDLIAHGMPVEQLAERMLEILGPHDLFASAPSWDGKWLSALLRAAGKPRHALRLRDTEEARAEMARAVLGDRLVGSALEDALADLLAETKTYSETLHVTHRALGDAQRERDLCLRIVERAKAVAAKL
jgi:hypothetical protein